MIGFKVYLAKIGDKQPLDEGMELRRKFLGWINLSNELMLLHLYRALIRKILQSYECSLSVNFSFAELIE